MNLLLIIIHSFQFHCYLLRQEDAEAPVNNENIQKGHWPEPAIAGAKVAKVPLC